MPLSMLLLALYVFLQSAVYLAWFAVDNKLLGLVGMAFVVVLLIETLFFVVHERPLVFFKRQP